MPWLGWVKPVTLGVPSKLSAVAPLVPVSTLNEMLLSSVAAMVSGVMSATAVTPMATLPVVVPTPSVELMLRMSEPL